MTLFADQYKEAGSTLHNSTLGQGAILYSLVLGKSDPPAIAAVRKPVTIVRSFAEVIVVTLEVQAGSAEDRGNFGFTVGG